MKTITFGLTIVTLAVVAALAHAASYPIPPLPDFPQSAWTAGTAITYRLQAAQGEDAGQCNLRIAILGTEHEVATDGTLYWVELDFTDIAGLPEDLEEYFVINYGETPSAIRVNMLIPHYDLTTFMTDPSRVYRDFTEPGFLNKLYFQYNRQTPYDVDILVLRGLVLPLVVSQLVGEELPEDFYDERNLGLELVQDAEAFITERSEGETTTEAGSFQGEMVSFTSSDDGPSGWLFHSPDIPILPLVSYMGDWMAGGGAGHVDMELVSIVTSGATSGIVGEPIVFNLSTLSTYGM